MLKALLVGTILTMTAAATDYHVGPGQAMTQIGQVPWFSLQPGDNVYIHYQPTPYYEKFLISGRGTPTQWIRVLGVPGPNGELPVISGNNATTSKNNHYYWQTANNMQWSGVVEIAVHSDPVNGTGPLPGYIEVANLQVQDGDQAFSFTAENGTRSNYDAFSSCIYAKSAQHILIRNNVLTNCGLGFYNWTGSGSSYYDGLAIDTVLRANYFYNNGVANSYLEHQTYTESDGVTIEYNRYGPTRAGMLGSQLKDRSAGTVIRYNYIEASGGGWMLDLVEPENSWDALGGKATYAQDFVYGNIFNNKLHSQNTIHWNEDHYGGIGRATVPGGRLSFYNNTMVTVANASDMNHYFLVNPNWGGYDCPSVAMPAVIDVRNNIIAALPRTAGSSVPAMQLGYCGAENFSLGKNWMSPGWYTSGGSVTGAANMFVPAINDPGFANLAGDDYHVLPGSSPTGIGQALPLGIVTNVLGVDQTPTQQYVYHTQVAPRASGGGLGSDLGAFDSTAPVGCSYAVSPTSNSFASSASNGTFSVTTGNACGWSASTSTAWIAITSGASGTGYGLVSYTVAANPTSAARAGSVTIAGSSVPVTQAGMACTYSLSATSSSLAAASGSGSVNVTGVTGCSWTAVSNDAWITVTSGASGSGNGSVGYSVTANTATTARSGSISVAGQTFTVSQAAAPAPCSYSISPASASLAAAGGTGSATVTAGTGCSWTGVSNDGWITVTSGASGSGNGSVGYSVAANTATSTRSGTVTIGGQTLTVSQAAAPAPCSYSISPASASIAAAGGTGSATVTAGTGCSWTGVSNDGWITVISGASGSGNGSVGYSVAANTATSTRSGTVTIGGQTLTISQAAPPAPCSYSISPANTSLAAAGGTGSATVTAGTGCSWTGVSNTAWITVTSGASGSGNGSVGYSVAANTATSTRSGTVTIGGQTLTISEAAAPAPCSYSISPASASIAATGGTGSATVTAGTGCSWTGVSNATWITVTSGAAASGGGSVGYSVVANTGSSTRSGTVTIGGQTLTISQAAVPPPPAACTYSVSPTTVSAPATGGPATLTVTAPAGCAWSVSSGASWVSITSGGSGSGNGSVVLNVASNNTLSPNTAQAMTTTRSASVIAAANTITVTQGSSSATPVTVSFRQGVNGYTGTADRNISTMYITESWNNGVGQTDPNGTTIFIKNDSEYEARGLVRFAGLNIPAGATITSATLTITFANWWIDTPPVVTGNYLNTAWNGTAAQAGLNWKNRDTGAVWTTPGAKGAGSDTIANKAFTFAPIPANGDMTQTVALDPAVVQGWINNPSSNQGVVLGLNSQTAVGRIQAYPSETSRITNRPMLTITYR